MSKLYLFITIQLCAIHWKLSFFSLVVSLLSKQYSKSFASSSWWPSLLSCSSEDTEPIIFFIDWHTKILRPSLRNIFYSRIKTYFCWIRSKNHTQVYGNRIPCSQYPLTMKPSYALGIIFFHFFSHAVGVILRDYKPGMIPLDHLMNILSRNCRMNLLLPAKIVTCPGHTRCQCPNIWKDSENRMSARC